MYFPDDVWKAHIMPLLLLPAEEFALQLKFNNFKHEYKAEPEFFHRWKVFETEQACTAALALERQRWPDWVGYQTRCCSGGERWGFLVGLIPGWVPKDVKAAVRLEEPEVYSGIPAGSMSSAERRATRTAFADRLMERLPDLLQHQYGSICFCPLVVRDWYIAVINDCNDLIETVWETN